MGALASGGGVLNATDATGYAANSTPDFIVKAAYEPGQGHYEVFGIDANYRAHVYPCFVTAGNPLPATCGGALQAPSMTSAPAAALTFGCLSQPKGRGTGRNLGFRDGLGR